MKKLIVLIILLSVLISGCQVIEKTGLIGEKSVEPKVIPGITSVTGVLVDAASGKALKTTGLHLAKVYRQKGKAAFLFDAANSPSGLTDKKGVFSITDLEAGEYVMIVGDPMSNYTIIPDVNGEPKVFLANGNEPVDTGQIVVVFK